MTAVPGVAAVVAMDRYAGSLYWIAGYFGLFLIHFSIIYTNNYPHAVIGIGYADRLVGIPSAQDEAWLPRCE